MTPIPENQALDMLAELPSHARVVVDFDETLWLSNSTLLYLDSVRPRWLAWLVFKMVSLCFRLLPGSWGLWRDGCALVAVTCVCPWVLWSWRRQADQLASTHANMPLGNALVTSCLPSQVVVCSFGMDFVIRPLLSALWRRVGSPVNSHRQPDSSVWAEVPLVACSWRSSGTDRRVGKRAMLANAGCPLVSDGPPWAVVTDSLDDKELLDHATHPLYVRWAAAQQVHLFFDLYLPLRYVHTQRHPGQSFPLRVVLYEEWGGLLLVYAPAVWAIPMVAPALLLLTLSFWVIYEQGYAENDRVAVQREGKQPQPHEQERFESAHRSGERWAWGWAGVLGFAAMALLAPASAMWGQTMWGGLGGSAWWVGGCIWLSMLAGMRLTYRVYNHLQPAPRVWLYPALQLWKLLPAALFLSIGTVGMAFVLAYTVSRWFPYWIYRAGGQRSGFPELALRTVLLLAGLLLVGQLSQASLVIWTQACLMVAYMLFRSRHELRTACRAFAWAVPQRPAVAAQSLHPHNETEKGNPHG